jgi:small subunit ribosomal protein S9
MFAEERDDLPQEPQATPPEEETPAAAVPGEPDDAAAPSEGDAEAVGPEIEGAEELAAASEDAASEDAASDQPAAEGAQPDDEAAEGAPTAGEGERRPRPGVPEGGATEEEVIPGMHLEPDLVLEEAAREDSEFGAYADDGADSGADAPAEAGDETPSEPQEIALTPLDLAADARYRATGKRKRAVARVILKPGEGTYSVNGRHLDEYFPRVRLQRMATQPLEATSNSSRMDVVARIHGGGISAQATALRHGIARALVEADPALRSELKRRGYLTRDPRVKERKKAGLKKARKRPQFSKR